MSEEIDIQINGSRDKISSIEEYSDSVVVNYCSGDQIRTIIVPKHTIEFVKSVIDQMEVGERYTSIYVYNHYIKHYKIKSKIAAKVLNEVKNALERRGMGSEMVEGVISDVKDVTLMEFQEFIGSREIKTSHYFRCYAAIRYWSEKGNIQYNQKGSIWRVL